jgi:hypothetical protein
MPPPSSIRKMLPSGPGLRFSRPRNMFVAMSSAGETARVWYTVSIPAARASIGRLNCTGWPSSLISPSFGTSAPDRHLIRVDLPAPLSPITASTSPG